MGYSHHYHHHGRVRVGRIIVGVSCLLVLGVNGLILKEAAHPPVPGLQLAAVISLLWMLAGAVALCARKNWGRPLMLTILYGGSFAFLVAGLIMISSADGSPAWEIESAFRSLAVYLILSLVLTNSKHVRRLTSRALE